ncbi:HAD-like domain-containing protein [Flagelloscypha sp. PMI_526]|nr:HAD-like domain-containing protein [Flagelloscypha sp. PMI_526]
MARPFFRAILLDLSGTIHIGATPTPSSISALRALRASGVPFRFCSNNSKDSPWTSLRALGAKIASLGLKRPYLLLSTSAAESLPGESLGHINLDRPYDAVVVGLCPDLLDYEHLNTAFRILNGEAYGSRRSSPLPLIATHKAKYIETSNPPGLSLGPGPFVTALEEATGAKAIVVGKPTADFFQMVIDDMKLPVSDDGVIAIVGDDVEGDLGEGALQLGLWRVLGKYRPGDESRPGSIPPNEIYDSFAAFVESLPATSSL